MPPRVLFICVNNSARSQMAEALLQKLGNGRFRVESAGMVPTVINPLVVEALREVGIDVSTKETTSVFNLFQKDRDYEYAITVCNESLETEYPTFPGVEKRIHLPFQDPALVAGQHKEKLAQVRSIRDSIQGAIESFIAWHDNGEQGLFKHARIIE